MILILSDEYDQSTTNVIEWLDYNSLKWIRINSNDLIDISFEGDDVLFVSKDNSFYLSEINSFWYRRGYILINNNYSSIPQFKNLQFEEMNKLMNFIYYKLKKIKSINSILNSDVNKLIVSDIARDLNILTPTDLIFSNREKLNRHIYKESNENSYVTKVVSGNCMQHFEDFTIYNYTKKILSIKKEGKTFFPSLVQNLVPKKYELRIFYLNHIFYSMAIFSQNDSQTSVDFRNYNHNKPNRTVAYKLPTQIEEKLEMLMKKLDLNCGSIDMIVTPDNEYVFLEVNPVGQFGMVSNPCNYNLESEIANFLCYE